MANFDYTRPGGVWNPFEAVLSAELADLDWKTAHAINGDGGVYSLVDDLIIGGAVGTHVQFYVPTSTIDSFDAYDVFTAHLTASFLDAVTFASTVHFNGDTYIGNASGDSLVVAAGSTFNGTAFFNEDVFFQSGNTAFFSGDANFAGIASFSDQAYFTGPVSFSDAVEFQAPIEVSDHITFSGNGKIISRQKTIAAAGNQTIVAKDYDSIVIPPGVMNNGDIITLSDTGASDGMRVAITSAEPTNIVTVVTPAGLSTPLKYTTGSKFCIEYERCAGVWRPISTGVF